MLGEDLWPEGLEANSARARGNRGWRPRRAMAGTDCGFETIAGRGRVAAGVRSLSGQSSPICRCGTGCWCAVQISREDRSIRNKIMEARSSAMHDVSRRSFLTAAASSFADASARAWQFSARFCRGLSACEGARAPVAWVRAKRHRN